MLALNSGARAHRAADGGHSHDASRRTFPTGDGGGSPVWVIGIGVKVVTPRMAKILLSHFGSWGRLTIRSVRRRLDLSPV